jgi:hypothetical protein
MKKSKSLEIRVSEEELAAWKAEAKKNGLTLADYARRRISLRPLKAKKRKYDEVLAKKGAAQEVLADTPEGWDGRLECDLSPEEARRMGEDRPGACRGRAPMAGTLGIRTAGPRAA